MERLYRLPGGSRVVVWSEPGVDGEAVSRLLRVLARVYSMGGPELVEARLYRSLETMETWLAGEEQRLGVVVAARFPVSHEAWTGVPRIHVAVDPLYTSLDRYADPLIGHEAIHALLHGSLEYYLSEPGLNPLAFYIAATTLKDLEVHVEMRRRRLSDMLQGLKGYWLHEQPPPWSPPHSPEELLDTLKASTVWIALGEQPPLTPKAKRLLEPLLAELERLAREMLAGAGRPWSKRRSFTRTVEQVLGVAKR